MSSKKAGVRRRRQHSAQLKARVALEAIQERRTVRLRGHTNRGVKVPTGQSTGCP